MKRFRLITIFTPFFFCVLSSKTLGYNFDWDDRYASRSEQELREQYQQIDSMRKIKEVVDEIAEELYNCGKSLPPDLKASGEDAARKKYYAYCADKAFKRFIYLQKELSDNVHFERVLTNLNKLCIGDRFDFRRENFERWRRAEEEAYKELHKETNLNNLSSEEIHELGRTFEGIWDKIDSISGMGDEGRGEVRYLLPNICAFYYPLLCSASHNSEQIPDYEEKALKRLTSFNKLRERYYCSRGLEYNPIVYDYTKLKYLSANDRFRLFRALIIIWEGKNNDPSMEIAQAELYEIHKKLKNL